MSSLPRSELIAPPHQARENKPKIKKKRASDNVADRLRSEIISGRLPVGSRLLPERKLAEVLGVSRVTVRSAIATLQSEQLLDVLRGSGITVLDFRRSSSIDIYEWLMVGELQDKEQQYNIFNQVVEVRRNIAIQTLFQAVGKVTDEFRVELRRLIEKQRKLIGDPEAYFFGDLELTQAIARQADNIFVELLHNSLKRAMLARMELVLAFMGNPEDHFDGYSIIMGLFDQGPEIANNLEIQQQATQLIGAFEAQGLLRVRKLIEELNLNQTDSAPPGLFQKGQ